MTGRSQRSSSRDLDKAQRGGVRRKKGGCHATPADCDVEGRPDASKALAHIVGWHPSPHTPPIVCRSLIKGERGGLVVQPRAVHGVWSVNATWQSQLLQGRTSTCVWPRGGGAVTAAIGAASHAALVCAAASRATAAMRTCYVCPPSQSPGRPLRQHHRCSAARVPRPS
jgi:hypothetical protein